MLTEDELSSRSETEKKNAMWARYAFTKTRPSLDEEKGKHKCRIVIMDLKVICQLPKNQTYNPTPPLEAFRLLLAAFDSKTEEIFTIDFITAYLQATQWPKSKWVLVKIKDPESSEIQYYWQTGPIYGGQTGGAEWYQTTRGHLKDRMGFTESQDAPSTYTNGTIRTSKHADDPIIVFNKSEQGQKDEAEFLKLMADGFSIKEFNELTPDNPIDYCSIRVQMHTNGDISIDNDSFIEKMLVKRNMADCNPTARPINTDLLMKAAQEREDGLILGSEAKTEHESIIGDMNWLVSTTHPTIATYVSILAGFNSTPTESSLKLCRLLIKYTKGTMGRRPIKRHDDKSGYSVQGDSDHTGLWKLTGDTRSRLGILIKYNGFPVVWKSAWIKARCVPSGKAETYALSECIHWALHIKYIGEELAIDMPSKPTIKSDATAALGFAGRTDGTGKMKHIDLREAWIEELKSDDIIRVKVPGTLNEANPFTKILGLSDFQDHEDAIMPRLE